MLTNPRLRSWMRAALVLLAGWLLVPALAEAQQPLFPNMTASNRKRVPCCEENPIYGTYRRQYYGYYPTCWRKFPNGWGCPSAELANVPEEMKKIEKDIQKLNEDNDEDKDAEAPSEPRTRARTPGNTPDVPLPDTEESPFNMPGDRPAATDPAPAAPGIPPAAADTKPVAPAPSGDDVTLPPLDLKDPGPAPAPVPPAGSADATNVNPSRGRRTLIGGLFDTLSRRR